MLLFEQLYLLGNGLYNSSLFRIPVEAGDEQKVIIGDKRTAIIPRCFVLTKYTAENRLVLRASRVISNPY